MQQVWDFWSKERCLVKKLPLLALALLLATASQAMADIIPFDFIGKAGSGLLSGNQNTVISGTPGSGGELVGGITFNTATNVLTMNVGWGSGNGFANLTGTATAGHLHGPTTSAAPGAFTQYANVKYPIDSLVGWNPSATAGGFNGTIAILPADVAALMAGQFYMNVHTTANGGGEIRGNLVAVPEPASLALGAFPAVAFLLRRRRPK